MPLPPALGAIALLGDRPPAPTDVALDAAGMFLFCRSYQIQLINSEPKIDVVLNNLELSFSLSQEMRLSVSLILPFVFDTLWRGLPARNITQDHVDK